MVWPKRQNFEVYEANLKYQIDIQVSPKKLLVVKIYEGDKAADILQNLRKHKTLELDAEAMAKIETVVKHHTGEA